MAEKLLRTYIKEVLSTHNFSETVDDKSDKIIRKKHIQVQKSPRAACCLILNDNGKVLAVSRKDDPTAFGLPGGKVDPGETPEEAAVRELQEETGLEATNLRQVFVREEEDGYTTHTFTCEIAGAIDTEESGVVKWVTPEVLFAGPFGTYNKLLWKQLGLPTSV